MKKFAASPLPNPLDIVPEILLKMDYYTEGPVEGSHGGFYFTNLAGKWIYKYKGGICHHWARGKAPNGQALKPDGGHLICDSQLASVVEYDSNGEFKGKVSPLVIGDLKVRCPNDIAIDQEKGFFFTDSVRDSGAVFFVGREGNSKVIARNIDYANGIIYHREQQALWIAESYKNRILKIDLKENESSPDYLTVFATLPYHVDNKETGNLPDGMALDAHGRIWIAHYGMQAVQVLSDQGDLMATYNSGIKLTSNLCFMGDELWITGGEGEPGPGLVSRLKVGIRGYPLF